MTKCNVDPGWDAGAENDDQCPQWANNRGN